MNAAVVRCAIALLAATSIIAPRVRAQGAGETSMPGMEMSLPPASPTPSTAPKAAPKALPNPSGRTGWPEPVGDSAPYTFALFDLLEYQRIGGVDALRWDFLGWYGGDRQRLWVKSEGTLYPLGRVGGQADLQLLYGKLIAPFFDFQAGVRVERHEERDASPNRVFAVVGLQGLAPGRFEVEPALFLSNKGKLSGRFTASLDLYQTQRLIWQPRFETELAAQADEEFGVESGVSDAELGVRLRYEISREFAPYVGVSYRYSLGATRERVVREGGQPNELQLIVGVRLWF
ncbi:MAG: copper resistance protein B [Burkholderiales bacterium]|nr:copper resistance protein B [Burkholderiales bacterium]